MSLFRQHDADAQLAQEIDTHLALQEDEYRRAGMSEQAARDAARRAFGGVLKTRQMYREQRRWHWLDTFIQDARFGLRMLVRDRAFAVTAIIVLGLGIGVNNMQFTIVYAHTLRGLPIEGAGRVLMASLLDERGVDRGLSYPEYQELLAGADRLRDIAAIGQPYSVALGDKGRAPDRYLAAHTTSSAFDALRIRPLTGRFFSPEEEQPGSRRAVILGATAWRVRYNSDASLIGREVLVNGQPAIVVGILPERSGFPSTAEVLLPVAQSPGFSPVRRDTRQLRAFGRVHDEASVEESRAQLETLLVETARRSGEATRGLLPMVEPINSRFVGRATDPAWMAFFAVGFLVVAVASANAANLMLARGVRRAREIAIRGSLGASRSRVVIQLLVESVVLAALGAIVGFIVSTAGVRVFESAVPLNSMPYWWRYSMDTTVFAALVMVSLGTVLIFGLIPAVQTSKADVSRVLKDGGWSGTGRMSARWLTTAFMVAQLGLSVVLLSYVVSDLVDDEAPVASDDIIGTDDVLTAALSLPGDRYPTPERRAEFLARLQERTRAVPGVTAAALTNTLPANGALELRLQQEPGVARHQLPSVWSVRVGPEYFQTLNVPLLRGREFTTTEPGGDAATAIVNQRFVEMFLRDRDAVGQRLTLVSANPNDAAFTTATIVGIAADIRHRYGQHDPIVYLPLSTGAPPLTALMVRSSVDTFTMTEQLREAVLALDANLPLFQIMTLDRVVHDAGWNVRVSSRLVTTLSLIVLLLSSVGLYAVTAHAVNQRSKEIGIRIAVGARPGQIRRLVLGRAGFQVMLGLFFGVLCTIAWDGMFFSGRVDKRLADPLVLGTIAALLASVTIAACVIPMRRAAQLDPITTLRQD